MSIALVIICRFGGLLIGAAGIGGVLLVPALTFAADIGVYEAIPASLLNYLVTGALGVFVYARHGSIRWDMVFRVCGGAVPAALPGSFSLLSIPANAIRFLTAILMLFAGIDAHLIATPEST